MHGAKTEPHAVDGRGAAAAAQSEAERVLRTVVVTP
jgi:hypothetical protein